MPKKERTVRLGNTKLTAIVFGVIVFIIAGRMIYVDIRDKRRGDVYQFETAMQEHFNALPYLSIDGDADKLRDAIASARIRLYGQIPEERVERLRERLFDLIWTHHVGGFDRYMRLRKPPGIEYQFNTNWALDTFPELDSEEVIMRDWVNANSYGTFYSNFVSQVCLDYKALQELRYWCYSISGIFATNSFFGVHIFRTNSLADPRLCADVKDFVAEADRWPYTSTNTVERFSLIKNTLLPSGLSIPTPLYFTAETPQQELETTGEITLAYVYFTFKGAYHSGNAAPIMAQWHWDKAKVRWILDYFCSGDDYRYPVSRYATEPHIFVTF